MTHSMNNYYNEIRSDIAKEFGLESAGYAPKREYALTIRQCAMLNDKYGFDKAKVIAKRYASLKKVGTN
jgi:hypothetical protein